jgi:uncharacterized protein with NAD-binding domain and iron-sulfur cluster
VVVVGAGIAGMTAAHELVERGYEIEVVEAAQDAQAPRGQPRALLGGLARTSWALVPQPRSQVPLRISLAAPSTRSATEEAPRRRPRQLKSLMTDRLLQPVIVPLTLTAANEFDPGPAVTSLLDEYRRGKGAGDDRLLSLIVVIVKPKAGARTLVETLGESAVAAALKKWIEKELKGDVFSLSVIAAGSEAAQAVQFSFESDRVPGEHGFRFFPSFYSHMFDTMRRIPIPEASSGPPLIPGTVLQADSSRSVFDNLVHGNTLEMAFGPIDGQHRAFQMTRGPAPSIEALRRFIANLLEKAGYRGEDLARATVRYLEYMTSCSERRLEYEDKTWAEFLGLQDGTDGPYSPYFVWSMKEAAQALVAMSATKSDARTIGSVSMQLVLDQFRAGRCIDGILNGPTTTALLDPWQTFLESQGVTFTQGSLVGFEGVGMAVRPAFGRPNATTGRWERLAVDPADFYVIAIPMHEFQGLFDPKTRHVLQGVEYLSQKELLQANEKCLQLEKQSEKIATGESRDDVRKYLEFAGLEKVVTNPDEGPLRYMCGIQFFFGAGVNLVEGHANCSDSPWGVTFLSQMQYWRHRQRGGEGVRAVVSAVFTRFEAEAKDRDGVAKAAIACTPQEVADRVWSQIESSWDERRLGRLPQPEYFYLDENLTYDEKTRTWMNSQPYVVNDLGTWPKRGGARTKDGDYEYCLQLGHTVFAGAFMRTTTRLNTMEAANESARRAVNAVLAADHSDVPRCRLWNMEDDEAPALQQLRDLDRRIFLRGGRHFLRSPSVEAMLRATPWELARLMLPTYPDTTGGTS